tara:strand:+ start:82 stop:294 length:213 start_codon:yes stop_codon:yes gene_type:complete
MKIGNLLKRAQMSRFSGMVIHANADGISCPEITPRHGEPITLRAYDDMWALHLAVDLEETMERQRLFFTR